MKVEHVLIETGLHDGWLAAVDLEGGGNLNDGGNRGNAAAESGEELSVCGGEGLAAAEIDHPKTCGDKSANEPKEKARERCGVALWKMGAKRRGGVHALPYLGTEHQSHVGGVTVCNGTDVDLRDEANPPDLLACFHASREAIEQPVREDQGRDDGDPTCADHYTAGVNGSAVEHLREE